MTERTLFKNRYGAVNIHLKNGKAVKFANSMHFTMDDDEQAELEEMAKKNEAGVFIDENNRTVDPNAASPQEIMERRMLEKLMREHPTLRNAVAQSGAGDSLAKFMQNSSIGNTAHEAGGNPRLANSAMPDNVVVNSQTGKPEIRNDVGNVGESSEDTSKLENDEPQAQGVQPTAANSAKERIQGSQKK